jgi:hypothetical protein
MESKKQTAVEWLQEPLLNILTHQQQMQVIGLFQQALAMEKEQIMKAARQCHFEGLRQTAKTSEEYIKYGEQYYNETYNK